MIEALKKIYGAGETEDERVMREFVNKCAEIKGLPQTPAPENWFLKDIFNRGNPLLKIINDEAKGSYVPVPIKVK
jgi:hypothetical protein